MTDLLLILLAALLGTLLLLGLAALLALRSYAQRALNLLYDIGEHAGFVSEEHLPAIRTIASDALHLLGERGRS
jgi:hypothetical protein